MLVRPAPLVHLFIEGNDALGAIVGANHPGRGRPHFAASRMVLNQRHGMGRTVLRSRPVDW